MILMQMMTQLVSDARAYSCQNPAVISWNLIKENFRNRPSANKKNYNCATYPVKASG